MFFCGDEYNAVKYICQQFDIIFDINAYKASRKISSDRTKISNYFAKRNIKQTTLIGKTYTDGLKYLFEKSSINRIESKEQAMKNPAITVSGSAIERWGTGFTQADYKNLDEHYKMLKTNNPNIDQNQEIFVKELCNLYMLQIRALRAGDSKEYINLSGQYSKTFNNAGLKTVEEKDDSQNATLGVTLATISQYTPEEFYKDKSLYKDYDDLADYVERFMLRPLRNLEYGSTDRDKEFFVPNEDDLDDE